MPEFDCAVVIFAPDDVAQAIQERQAFFDPGFGSRLYPHVTVRAMRGVKDAEGFTQAVATVCALTPPFTLSLRGLGRFESPDNNVIYLAVVKNPALQRFHEALRVALNPFGTPFYPQYEGPGYVPHMTLLHGLQDFFLDIAWEELSDFQPAFDFRVDRVAVACREQGGEWGAPRYLSLGGTNSVHEG